MTERAAPTPRTPARLIAILAVMLLALVWVASGPAEAIATGVDARTVDNLNLRTGPSTSYPIILMIPCGGQVHVLSGPYNTSWYRVRYGTREGYVHGGYLVRRPARTVTTLNTSRKVVSLTFDAGSDKGYARLILDTLAQKNVQASFGMTGKWAETYPGAVRRMARDGHDFINHSYSHASFTGHSTGTAPLTYAQRRSELRRTERIIQEIAGIGSKPLFRPPYGDHNTCVLSHLREEGYRLNVMWTVDSFGWRGYTRSQILRRVLDGLQPGGIYIFHVGGASQDGPALARIIDEIRARGYSFVRVSDRYG